MKKFFNDFKAFILRGNILDMAVGIVIGSAFASIVSSLVTDIITPLISLITGKIPLTDLKAVLVPAEGEAAEIAITYGVFIKAIIDFLIIALALFLVLRAMMKVQAKIDALKKKEAEQALEEAAPQETELDILKDIRDSLKKA